MAFFGEPAELRLAGADGEFTAPVAIRAPRQNDEADEFTQLSLDVPGAPLIVVRRGYDPVIIATRIFINCSGEPISLICGRAVLSGDVLVLPRLEEKEEVTLRLSRTNAKVTQALPSDWATVTLALCDTDAPLGDAERAMIFSLQSADVPGTFGKGRAFHLYPGAIVTNSTTQRFDVREHSIGRPHPLGCISLAAASSSRSTSRVH
jgi:hypothetical protein